MRSTRALVLAMVFGCGAASRPPLRVAPARSEPASAPPNATASLALDASTPTPRDPPEPPNQRAPWSVRGTDGPTLFVSSMVPLFDQLIADPRGCEYRAVTLTVGSEATGRPVAIETAAFVIPAQGAQTRRWVIAWNGLVYAALRVGAPADLHADARVMLSRAHAVAAQEIAWPFDFAIEEAASVAVDSEHATRALLLYRLGLTDLATQLANTLAGSGQWPRANADPYLAVARRVLWDRYNRALWARLRSDDTLALYDLRAIERVRTAVENEASRRGIPHEQDEDADQRVHAVPYLNLIDGSRALLADQQRREADTRPRVDPVSISDARARIAERIRDLESFGSSPTFQADSVSLVADERVQALVHEGLAAVEPLIEALENDRRLTRATARSFHRLTRYRHVIDVGSLALSALEQILGQRFTSGPVLDPAQLAARIRAYWTAYRGSPPEQRWLVTLRDDGAGPLEWARAAANIASRTADVALDFQIEPTDWPIATAATARSDRAMLGESLRTVQNPSISDTLIGRIEALAAGARWELSCSLTMSLAAWSGRDSLAALRAQSARVSRTLSQPRDRGDVTLSLCLAGLTLARADIGDGSALDEYAAWVERVAHEPFAGGSTVFPNVFAPLWRYAANPSIARAGAALFGPHSAWLPFVAARAPESANRSELLSAPMLRIPAVRAHVIDALADHTPVGVYFVSDQGELAVRVSGVTTTSRVERGASLGAIRGPRPLRRCDAYAWFLNLGDALEEPWELYWPEPRRDEGLRSATARLRAMAP